MKPDGQQVWLECQLYQLSQDDLRTVLGLPLSDAIKNDNEIFVACRYHYGE